MVWSDNLMVKCFTQCSSGGILAENQPFVHFTGFITRFKMNSCFINANISIAKSMVRWAAFYQIFI